MPSPTSCNPNQQGQESVIQHILQCNGSCNMKRTAIQTSFINKFLTALNQGNRNLGQHVTRLAEFHTKVPSISGYSVWNLLHITHLPPVNLKGLLHFLENSGTPCFTHTCHKTTSHTLQYIIIITHSFSTILTDS